MSVLNQSGEEQVECPLCMEPLEVDDLNFYPCTCGYQICRFCWHRIRTDENSLCPACRKAYSENPADFTPLSKEQVAQLKVEKRQRDQQRKAKLSESRKHLASVRVVQKNLVFVVGLPVRLADADVLKRHEYFGKFGKIHKVVINQSTSYAGSQGPSASAYVTYVKSDDALRAIQNVNNIMLDGRLIKSSLGTTKYCSHFMKNQPCPKNDCMYLHDFGDAEASFTKEQMHAGKHQEYEKKLHEALLSRMAIAAAQQQQQQNATDKGGSDGKSKTQVNNNNSKESTWPTLINTVTTTTITTATSTTTTTTTSITLTTDTITNSNKIEKQKSSEKGSKKSNSQKNKNNNNNNNINNNNNNIEDVTKNEKINRNCEQTNCQQSVTPTTSSSSLSAEILTTTTAAPTILKESVTVTTLVLTPTTTTTTTLTDCIDSLTKIHLLDDNTSFFSSHNSFQKLMPPIEMTSAHFNHNQNSVVVNSNNNNNNNTSLSNSNCSSSSSSSSSNSSSDNGNGLMDSLSSASGALTVTTTSSSTTHPTHILNDSLPDINSSEDWQAAFGFITSHNNAIKLQKQYQTKLDQIYHLDNYQKPYQKVQAPQMNYDEMKLRDSLLDILSNHNHCVTTAVTTVTTATTTTTTSAAAAAAAATSMYRPEHCLNGLDQQMSKLFTELNKTQQQHHHNGYTTQHHNNGYVNNGGAAVAEHGALLLNQYQQRLEEQQALFNLKQQQQQYALVQQQQQHAAYLNGGDHHFISANQNGHFIGNGAAPYTHHNTVYQPQQQQQQQRTSVAPAQVQVQLRDRSSVVDDLGFDPFHETQKALAELIESEQISNGNTTTTSTSQHTTHLLNNNNNSVVVVNDMLHGNGGGSSTTLPPPPPGFMQHHNTHMNSFGSKILPFLNMSSSQQIPTPGGWSTNYTETQQLKNVPPVNDWMTLDPAIVSSSRHFPLASLQSFSTTDQQQQQQQYNNNVNNTFGHHHNHHHNHSHPLNNMQQQQQHHQRVAGYDYQPNGYTFGGAATNNPFGAYQQPLAPQQNGGLGVNWFDGQISSPPGFRNASSVAAAAAVQSKTQEC